MPINPEDFGATTVTIDPEQFGAIANVDEERGAPARVRASVSASKTPQDRLSTLQMFYPDAQPWGQDNFVYTDPETKNRTLYNPKGLDMGDVTESTRMIYEFLGGAIGGGAALVAGQMGPQALAPEEIITVPTATGLGAAAGGKVFDTLADIFLPHVETRGALEQMAEMGTDTLANAVGARAGELLEGAVKAGAAKGAQMARATTDEVYRAFGRMGAEPTAGAVSGSKTIQGIEQALAKLPASADIMGTKYGKLLDDMGEYAENVARISPVEGREQVGASVRRGLDRFVGRFTAQASELYDRVDRFIPGSTRVQSNNFGQQLQRITSQFADDPEYSEILTSPLMTRLQSAYQASVNRGGMTYNTLRGIRSQIGKAINQQTLLADASQAELRQLYGALSDDVMRAAGNVGDDALRAATRANTYWRAGRARIDDILQPVVNKKLNQDVFKAAMSGTKDGAEKLRALKKSLPQRDWLALVGNQIKEMGMATPGRQDVTGELFSPHTFLTNYNRLSKAAKKTLFSGPRYKGLEKAIDDLVTTSAAVKDLAGMANTSGTAQQLIYMQLLTGGLGGALAYEEGESPTTGMIQGAAAGFIAPWASAKLITSPQFINWLTSSADIAVSQTGVGSHLGRLIIMAEKDKELAPAIYEYLRVIQGEQNEQ